MIEIEFSNPVSVMNSDILSYLEVALIDDLYEPPIALDTLAKALRVNPMHSSAIEFKRNTLTYAVTVSDVLPRRDLKRFIQDYLTFGNGYFQVMRNLFGQVVHIRHLPALYMRRRGDLGYTYKPRAYSNEGRIDYRDGQIFHLAEYDVAQELYGLPQHVSGLTSIWLNDVSPPVLPQRLPRRLPAVYERAGHDQRDGKRHSQQAAGQRRDGVQKPVCECQGERHQSSGA